MRNVFVCKILFSNVCRTYLVMAIGYLLFRDISLYVSVAISWKCMDGSTNAASKTYSTLSRS